MKKRTRPNFLFIFPDQHRGDWLPGNCELPLHMPALAQLAEEGICFSNAMTPSPLCAPARACLASGRSYDRIGVWNNGYPYPLEIPTYYQALREAGYMVCGVGKFDLDKPTLNWNLDGSRRLTEWGFSCGCDSEGKLDAVEAYRRNGKPMGPYMAYLERQGLAAAHLKDFEMRDHFMDIHPTPLPEHAYSDNWIAEQGMQYLEQFPEGKPWHLAVNFTGPHMPMDVTQEMRSRRQNTQFPEAIENDTQEETAVNGSRQNYAAMLENIDKHLAAFLKLVEDRGELENTVIIYSSDHGEMLGDYGRWGKTTWHHPSVHIPLIMTGPGIGRGKRSDALVSLHDLSATILELAGLSRLPGMDARSIVPVLSGSSDTHRDILISGMSLNPSSSWRMIFDGRHKYIRRSEAAPLLFDLKNTPQESEECALKDNKHAGLLHERLLHCTGSSTTHVNAF